MLLKQRIEQAFGREGETRVLNFLREKELAECKGDTARWIRLFEKCECWREAFLLWEDGTYISGIDGWNLSINVCRVRLPKEPSDDWTTYLYRMTLLVVISNMEIDQRNTLIQSGDQCGNLGIACEDFSVNSDHITLTQDQWLCEIQSLRLKSWNRYQVIADQSSAYHETMEKNYPKFDAILDYLRQNTSAFQVVRMNHYGGDECVWYFAEEQGSFLLMRVSDTL